PPHGEAPHPQPLGLSPVDPALVAESLPPPLELLPQLGMHGEALGNLEQLLVQLPEGLLGDAGFDRSVAPAARSLLLFGSAGPGGDRLLEQLVGVLDRALHAL